MSLSLQKISEIRRKVTIPIEREKLNVWYYLSKFDTDLVDWINEHGEERNSLLEWIERVVDEWDLVDEGAMVPITAASIEDARIPTPILRMIQRAINEDSEPDFLKRSSSTRSRSGSAPSRSGTGS